MKRFTFSAVLLLLTLTRVQAYSACIDSLLCEYDSEIVSASMYFDQRLHRIEQTALLNTPEAWLQVAELYRPYQCDSSIVYYTRALHADEPYATRARLCLIYQLAAIGYYSEADLLKQDICRSVVDTDPQLLIAYYDALNRLYSESSVYGKMENFKASNWQKGILYRDSLFAVIQTYSPHSARYYKMRLTQERDNQRYTEALLLSDTALSLVEELSHDYAILAYERAIIYRDMQDEEHYMQWLIKSAIADVKQGVTDNGSSWMLAQIVFADEQLDRAYQYIQYSLTNAGIFNARLRYVQINPLGHIINQAYQKQQTQQSRRIQESALALAILVLLLVMLFLFTIGQYRKAKLLNNQLYEAYDKQAILNGELNSANTQLSELNQQLSSVVAHLQEANIVKEQYICRYLQLYSAYIQRITALARKGGEKNTEALHSREMAEFYRSFDQTFLSIYGSFVSDFNALLQPEQRILPKQGELLTTELRIFALIRLGIDSSAKIAQLLCYAPNTIYNYRARIRNAAIGDRDDFENKVRLLCSI